MSLNQKIKDRISSEADDYAHVSHEYLTEGDWERERNGYISGAEAETERAAEIIDLYKQLVEVMNDELSAMESHTKDYKANRERVVRAFDLQNRIKEALTNYNSK